MHLDSDSGCPERNHLGPAIVLYPLAHLALEVYNGMLSIMWPLFQVRFGLTFGAIGALTMIFRGSMTLPQPAFAALGDRHGRRLLAVAGLVCMATGLSLVGLAPGVPALALLLALAPLGSAAFHPAGTGYMSRALPRRRGLAVALFMIGGTMGMSLGPVIGAWLYERQGLGASPWLLPLGLGVALLVLLFVPPDSAQTARRTAEKRPSGSIPPAIYLLMAVAVGQSCVENGLHSYLPLLYKARGLPLGAASRTLFAIAAPAALGLLLGGALSDRIPRWRIILPAQVLTLPLYLGTLLPVGDAVLPAAAGLGFVSALTHPTVVALAQDVMPERSSLASALTMGISWVIGSLIVALIGVAADYIGMQQALVLNTALPVIGIACMLAVLRLSRQPAALSKARPVG